MDELVWEGAVRLEGAVEVPAGRTLTIRAGARIAAAGGCALRVEGRLVAEGAPAGGEILFSPEGPWQGITLSGAATASLRLARLKGAENGLRCEGESRAGLFGVEVLEARSVGVLATGRGRVVIEDSLIALGESGVTLHEEGRAELRRCRLVVNELCGVNAMGRSRLLAEGCRFEGNHTALSLRDRGRADLRACVVTRHHVGVYARDACSLNLVGNRFLDNRQAVELLDQARVSSLVGEPEAVA